MPCENERDKKCNASCSRGWLRRVVQFIFGTITVASFVIIVYMAMHSSKRFPYVERCLIVNCKVVCRDTPTNGLYESAIITAVTAAGLRCKLVDLELYNPTFRNGILPHHWLANMRTPIYSLSILAGNLRYIEPEAFMSQFTGHMSSLVFQKITIDGWKSDTFVGITKLKSLYANDCVIKSIEHNTLRPIKESLNTLTISNCGHWKPDFMTGSSNTSQLETVDFSFNNFPDVLGKNSFRNLRNCKVLYLNSCEIEAIEDETFDPLQSLEVIYLNHNKLKYIAPRLFQNVLETVLDLRVMLQNNPWHCQCSNKETYDMLDPDIFILDPVCYFPESARDKTFDEFRATCNNNKNERLFGMEDDCDPLFTVGGCCRSKHNSSLVFVTPLTKFECPFDTLKLINMTTFDLKSSRSPIWFRPMLFIKSFQLMMIQADSFEKSDTGLIWHTSSCPNEYYCINIFPNFMKRLIVNTSMSTNFKFCPLQLRTGTIEVDECFEHHYSNITAVSKRISIRNVYFRYILSGVICIFFGALFVYAIIFKNPSLLKGNKRVLFVKHKNVDVLVLPPKLPPRNDHLSEKLVSEINDDQIFVIPDKKHNLCVEEFTRSISTRSTKSYAPSYVSAVQPTADQLAEWRLKHHFDNTVVAIKSHKSDSSLYSRDNDFDAAYFSTTESCDIIYETLK